MFLLSRHVATLALFCLGLSSIQASGQTGVVSLVGELTFPGFNVTDVTSYVDPISNSEYAIVGFSGSASGIIIVDLSDPADPKVVKTLDGVPGFDVKVFQHYAYTVNGGLGSGAIIDISDPANAVEVAQFPSSHNITIDPRGYLYAEVRGLIFYNLIDNPTVPAEIWNDDSMGGHDATILGTRLYDFHGSSTTIYDVSDPANPVELGFIDPPFINYHHSGWTTEDSAYLFINDELSLHPRADVTVWDISDPENPDFVTNIADSTATVHNVQIRDHLAFFSYYSAGFKVFDISDPTHPNLVGHYDTDPETGESFSGAFGVDTFLPSRHVLISGSSGVTGSLHIFRVDGFTPVSTSDPTELPTSDLKLELYPNPVAGNSPLNVRMSSAHSLDVVDMLGRLVYTYEFSQRGTSQSIAIPTGDFPAGVYMLKVTNERSSITKSFVKTD